MDQEKNINIAAVYYKKKAINPKIKKQIINIVGYLNFLKLEKILYKKFSFIIKLSSAPILLTKPFFLPIDKNLFFL